MIYFGEEKTGDSLIAIKKDGDRLFSLTAGDKTKNNHFKIATGEI